MICVHFCPFLCVYMFVPLPLFLCSVLRVRNIYIYICMYIADINKDINKEALLFCDNTISFNVISYKRNITYNEKNLSVSYCIYMWINWNRVFISYCVRDNWTLTLFSNNVMWCTTTVGIVIISHIQALSDQQLLHPSINSFRPTPDMVQVKVCRLFVAKTLPESMLAYGQLNP